MQSCSFTDVPVAVPLSTVKQGQVLACWDTDTSRMLKIMMLDCLNTEGTEAGSRYFPIGPYLDSSAFILFHSNSLRPR